MMCLYHFFHIINFSPCILLFRLGLKFKAEAHLDRNDWTFSNCSTLGSQHRLPREGNIYTGTKKISLLYYLFIFCFLGPHLQHIPRLGVQSELQLPASITAIATQDLNSVCHLHHSSWQCWIPDPLSQARDWTCILMDTSCICFHCATTASPLPQVWVSLILNIRRVV